MKGGLYIHPYLNDFFYNVLYHASEEQKKNIPGRLWKKVKTNSLCRKFSNKSFLEEKLEVMSAVGMTWFLVVMDVKKNKVRSFGNFIENYEPCSDTQSLMSQIIENKIYILSDRNYALNMGIMADNSNHPVFAQNLLLDKAGFHLKQWRKNIGREETKLAKEHLEVSKYLVETMLNTAITLDLLDGFLGIARNDFKVLSYLYTKHHTYVSYDELLQRFSGHLGKAKITGCVRRLSINGMIQKKPDAYSKEYQISTIGIKAIVNFWRHILKANEIA